MILKNFTAILVCPMWKNIWRQKSWFFQFQGLKVKVKPDASAKISLYSKPGIWDSIWNIFQVNWSSLKEFIAIYVTSTQDFREFQDLKKSRFWIGVTKIVIKFFKIDQLTWKLSQIEADTCGCKFRLIFGANIWFYNGFQPLELKKSTF